MNYKHTLDKRLVIMFIISTGLMTIFQGLATNWFIRGEIEEWQLGQLNNSKNVTINLIRSRLDSLETLTLDYAVWDSTYQNIVKYHKGKFETFFSEADLPISDLDASMLCR